MATLPSLPLFTTTPFLSSPKRLPLLFPTPSAASSSPSETEPESGPPPKDGDDDPFEARLSHVRLRYRSGTGKKAEIRKSKKGATASANANAKASASSSSLYLPPVPLKEPVSEGLKVEFGFSPYSERVNGRIAILGLTALLVVEIATGKSVISYHTPAIVLIQVYFVAAVAALYFKYEKERVSVWPESSSKD